MAKSATPPVRHTWRFFRAGGFDQVRLDSAADLVALGEGWLDQKLWVALACPARGLEFDEKTLQLLDTENDKRIRAPEIIAATKWACSMLKDPAHLVKGESSLPLAAIQDRTPEGKALLASARQILANLGKPEAAAVTIDDVTDTARIFAQTKFNGDGAIPADASDNAAVNQVLADIVACCGSVPDRSGKPGVDTALVDRFFAEAQAYADWWAKGEKEATVAPLGEATLAGHQALAAVRAKVEDYFARCRLAAFDPRALAALNRQETDYLSVAAKDLSISAAEVAGFPLAKIEGNRPLPLLAGLNPAWEAPIAAFRDKVVQPILGKKESLTDAEWQKLVHAFAGFEGWMAAKAGAAVEKLGPARVREILKGRAKAEIAALIARDKALEPEANSIASVHRLVRLHRDLFKLLNNFVNFRDFYGRREKAIFQSGTLYLDQRSCDLCLRVEDPGKHATLAGLAKTYLAYCDCTRPQTGEKMTIAAAFTGGDSDQLMVGRNGLFYDRLGRDWDATITKIVDNPISIRQAFWSPYKRFVRMIEEQVAKRAAAAEAASTAKLETAAVHVATADQKAAAAPAAPAPKKIDVGVVAAMGVAVGAIGTAVASLVTGVLGLKAWQIALVPVALMLVISSPAVVIAWLKLRQRNLGPILDANGWAVNARAKVNIPFGGSLTSVATLPPGAERDLRDPYAPPKSLAAKIFGWFLVLLVVAAIGAGLWYFGVVEKVLPDRLPKSGWYEKRHPAPKPAEAAPPATPVEPPATPPK